LTAVEYTDEFGAWWEALTEAEQESVAYSVGLLEARGMALGHPHSSQTNGSRHAHMRELRVQHQGRSYRVFYAFDPRRKSILLVGGDKTGDRRFYEKMIPEADRLYDEHLKQIVGESDAVDD
jgi:hypothetical protein